MSEHADIFPNGYIGADGTPFLKQEPTPTTVFTSGPGWTDVEFTGPNAERNFEAYQSDGPSAFGFDTPTYEAPTFELPTFDLPSWEFDNPNLILGAALLALLVMK